MSLLSTSISAQTAAGPAAAEQVIHILTGQDLFAIVQPWHSMVLSSLSTVINDDT